MIIDNIKSEIANQLNINQSDVIFSLPPSLELGDFSFSVFSYSKTRKINPANLAEAISKKLENIEGIEKISYTNGYINFFIDNKAQSEIVDSILDGSLLKVDLGQNKKIMVEFFSPNTNKPLHIGHLRNLFIGDSLCRLMVYVGYQVVRANLYNDRGIHICKAQLAYDKWGEKSNPLESGKKGDHFVGDFYVMYNLKAENNPDIEDEAQLLLQKWEKEDKEVVQKWLTLRDWVIDGFNQTLTRLGISTFDVIYWESEYWRKGVDLVKEGLSKGVFREGENHSIIADLNELGIKPILRADGTALYLTQDLFLASKKFNDYPNLIRSIYVVAAEQTEHFKALFEILKLLGCEWNKKCYHLGYGMILIKGGKLKSREGITADADTTIDDLENLASQELRERNSSFDSDELKLRASKIALSALKWEFLKVNALSNINFNPESSLDLKGNTGPYILYTYARISSLKRKAVDIKLNYSEIEFSIQESEIISLLYFYPFEIIESVKTYNFSNLCNYLFQLATKFNTYYQVTRIIDDGEASGFRLNLAGSVAVILKEGLQILGIETLEEM